MIETRKKIYLTILLSILYLPNNSCFVRNIYMIKIFIINKGLFFSSYISRSADHAYIYISEHLKIIT